MEFKEFINLSEMPIDLSRGMLDVDRSSYPVDYLKKANKKVLAYHGSHVRNFWDIVRRGFVSNIQNKRHPISHKNTTYFGTDLGTAQSFAGSDDYIIFVVELPGNLIKGGDDIFDSSIRAKKRISAKNIVGVYYPPIKDKVFYKIQDFVNLVQKGKIKKITPGTWNTQPFGQPSERDIENYVAVYLADLAQGVGIDEFLNYDDIISTHILRYLPPYKQIKNWKLRELVKFFQHMIDKELEGYTNKKRWELPADIFDKFPDIPIKQAIKKYQEKNPPKWWN